MDANTGGAACKSLERLPECSVHGAMELVTRASAEQAWCGVWYRCTRCTSSVLLPSPQLVASHQRPMLAARGNR